MVTASELREGMALRIEHEVYTVLEVESKAGAAKMAGTVRVRLSNVRSGRLWDQHFRPPGAAGGRGVGEAKGRVSL
jgi:translation elongation factor P/translation initiation factor 5A